MTQEQYNQELKQIRQEFAIKERDLNKKYAFENNPYKVGDVIKDHIGAIRIEVITFVNSSSSSKYPLCVYTGSELKKDGTVKKNGAKRQVWQCNIEAR